MRPTPPKDALQKLDREFIDRVSAILSGAATIADQMSGELLTFRWNSATQKPTVQLKKLTARPLGVVVVNATSPSSPSTNLGGVAIQWSFASSKTGASVAITDLAVTASTDFDVVAWAIGG